jgi:hypothetical protein
MILVILSEVAVFVKVGKASMTITLVRRLLSRGQFGGGGVADLLW